MNLNDRRRGCLLGLAVGDALGAAVEFKSPGSFKPVEGYRAGGPHGLAAGEWTDDTSMALALADSIAQAGWSLDDQAQRYVAWWRKGHYSVNGKCFDVGNATRLALSKFEQTRNAATSGNPAPGASGNGSIMRLAPVPIRFVDHFPNQVEQLAILAAESSLPTHASPQCLSACRYLAIILAGLMHGLDRDEVLSADWQPLQKLREHEPLHPEVDAVAAGSFCRLQPPAITGSGYVVKSLEAALWAFHHANDFQEAVLKAVNLGDDADSTGAVCGQIAGAYWGESGMPQSWLQDLAQRQMLEQALAGLLAAPTMAPPDSSYWVIPGRLLAGAYPGAEDPSSHAKRLNELLAVGVNAFINLMEADETNYQGKSFNPYEDDVRSVQPDTICIRLPIVDDSVPTKDQMAKTLATIEQFLSAGRTVYVHCWGGVGRTGTVVGCWLLERNLATASNVLEELAILRRQDKNRGDRTSPQTNEQRRFVKNWIVAKS